MGKGTRSQAALLETDKTRTATIVSRLLEVSINNKEVTPIKH